MPGWLGRARARRVGRRRRRSIRGRRPVETGRRGAAPWGRPRRLVAIGVCLLRKKGVRGLRGCTANRNYIRGDDGSRFSGGVGGVWRRRFKVPAAAGGPAGDGETTHPRGPSQKRAVIQHRADAGRDGRLHSDARATGLIVAPADRLSGGRARLPARFLLGTRSSWRRAVGPRAARSICGEGSGSPQQDSGSSAASRERRKSRDECGAA